MSKIRFDIAASAATLLLASGSAFAHPGGTHAHAMEFFAGLLHLLTEPDHLAMLAVAVVTAVLVVRRVRARRRDGANGGGEQRDQASSAGERH